MAGMAFSGNGGLIPGMQPATGLPGQDWWGQATAAPMGQSLAQPAPAAPMMAPQAQAAPTSPLAGISGWKAALGGLFDGISTATGGHATFVPAMLQYQQQQQQMQAARQKQIAEMYQPRDVGGNLIQLTPGGAPKVLYSPPSDPKVGATAQKIADLRAAGASDTQIKAFVDSETDPTTVLNNGDGTFTPVRHSQLAGATGVPPAAIDYLRKNPHFAPQFDQKYGLGASARYLNGGSGATPNTFPAQRGF